MGRQRVTDDQMMMVQSHKFQQLLARVSAFAGSLTVVINSELLSIINDSYAAT